MSGATSKLSAALGSGILETVTSIIGSIALALGFLVVTAMVVAAFLVLPNRRDRVVSAGQPSEH
mgnify:CR=1 FL=1